MGERGVPISSVIATAVSVNQTDKEKEVVRYINDVVTPNSTTISAPSPESSGEIINLIKGITERVLYGELNAVEASELLYTQGNIIFSTY